MPGFMTSSDEDENQPPCKPAEVVGVEKNDDGGESLTKVKKKKVQKVEKLKPKKRAANDVLKPVNRLKLKRTESQWGLSTVDVGDRGSSSEDDQEVVKEEVKKKLEKFVESSAHEMTFSSKLNSFKRKQVHQVAEEVGLLHQTEKKGKKKRLVVKKVLKMVESGEVGGMEGLGEEEQDCVEPDEADQAAEEQGAALGEEKLDGANRDVEVGDSKDGVAKERAGVPKAVPGQEAVFVAGDFTHIHSNLYSFIFNKT